MLLIMEFWNIDNGNAQIAPVTDSHKIEKRLGIKFPQLFIDLMKISNGGCPIYQYYFSEDEIAVDKEDIWPLEFIGKLSYIENLTFDDELENFIPNPEMLFAFSNQGSRYWCFDYRLCGLVGEPQIQFVYSDYDGEPRIVLLAKNFETFINGLKLSTEEQKEKEQALEWQSIDSRRINIADKHFSIELPQGWKLLDTADTPFITLKAINSSSFQLTIIVTSLAENITLESYVDNTKTLSHSIWNIDAQRSLKRGDHAVIELVVIQTLGNSKTKQIKHFIERSGALIIISLTAPYLQFEQASPVFGTMLESLLLDHY